ncbi:MAG: hypothetical protein KBD63_05480 [Bacteriovoracaceae bacterium]|nr:hypothetical protein [Bacteriovoracaceae bacterium]
MRLSFFILFFFLSSLQAQESWKFFDQVEQTSEGVRLRWTTSDAWENRQTNLGTAFVIQRNTDLNCEKNLPFGNWIPLESSVPARNLYTDPTNPVGIVLGIPSTFEYVDRNPKSGLNCYRIIFQNYQVEPQDLLGSINYIPTDLQFALFPNPASISHSFVKLKINNPNVENVTVSIQDIAGTQTKLQNMKNKDAEGHFLIDINSLIPSVYLFHVSFSLDKKIHKFTSKIRITQ